MPVALHRDDVGWLAYSAERDEKRVRRFPFRERGEKTAVYETIRKELGLSPTDRVPAALLNYSINAEGQFIRD